MSYTPSAEILRKYADVLIKFALNSGEGVRPGEVVLVMVPECAKPMYLPLQQAVLEAGGHPMMQLIADDVQAQFLATATPEQVSFFPDTYFRGLVDQVDHTVRILAESDKYELAESDPAAIISRQRALRPWMEWRTQKENRGELTWTLAMYGTPAMAADVQMTEEEYWQQIIAACYLDQADPIAAWKATAAEIERLKGALDELQIDSVHVQSDETDLVVGIGEHRSWMGGSGRNIPSFELFISPDCRRTEGTIYFNQPLYRYGNVIEGIRFTFENGVIVKATAEKGQALLDELLATEGAKQIGEFSLTDRRFSKITKLMGETLFDENMGGEQGNTHLAVGNAYEDSYPGDVASISKEQFAAWGYNQSAEHCDIISTARRTVTATLADGTTKVIYQDGQFTL
jgi:aminopeptidase